MQSRSVGLLSYDKSCSHNNGAGDASFIEKLEGTLGRKLSKNKPGPKPKGN
jgi:hypothetical protein